MREIDQHWLAIIGDHDVELVEIPVNQPVLSELDRQIHQFRVEFSGIPNLCNLTKRVSPDQVHDHAVSVEIVRSGYGESIVVEDAHKGVFPHGSEAREVEPVASFALLEIVPLFFYFSE